MIQYTGIEPWLLKCKAMEALALQLHFLFEMRLSSGSYVGTPQSCAPVRSSE